MTAADCVQEMRSTVHKETGLTVSAGIAPNKVRRTASITSGSTIEMSQTIDAR